ncbi:MAG: hypothetical protein CSA26_06175 [Desulfobacterales bacterium]|nr:MAG: hypothetical protein CSA26_06175 [Desulfobacterales bacterium]
MSIRLLAIELYRAQKKVHTLSDQLENAAIKEKERLRGELRAAEAECRQLRRMIDAQKESAEDRVVFNRFLSGK